MGQQELFTDIDMDIVEPTADNETPEDVVRRHVREAKTAGVIQRLVFQAALRAGASHRTDGWRIARVAAETLQRYTAAMEMRHRLERDAMGIDRKKHTDELVILGTME